MEFHSSYTNNRRDGMSYRGNSVKIDIEQVFAAMKIPEFDARFSIDRTYSSDSFELWWMVSGYESRIIRFPMDLFMRLNSDVQFYEIVRDKAREVYIKIKEEQRARQSAREQELKQAKKNEEAKRVSSNMEAVLAMANPDLPLMLGKDDT